MARLPRLTLPGTPHHVLQRTLDQAPLFTDDADYGFMHELLIQQARQHEVAVHAYLLMPTHFHLLLTPARAESLPGLMQGIGRQYVRHRNARAGRRGTLWEGRFRSAPLQAQRYLLPCMVYLDLQPLQGGLVEEPQAWAWSSHAHYVGLRTDRLVVPHPDYWALGNTPFAREQAYGECVAEGLAASDIAALADSVLHGWALGDAAFIDGIEQQAGRRARRAQPGRPRARY
jgi:putative transposase